MKKITLAIIGFAAIAAIYYAYKPNTPEEAKLNNSQQAPAMLDEKDADYTIEGKRVKLVNGYSEEAVQGSTSKIITRYFGNEVRRDLNGDDREDVVFIVTRETGGSGVFYYVVAALNTDKGYIGSHGLLLGDRIAPQTTEMSQNPKHVNVIIVNYAVRKPGEPFTAKSSVGKSIWLKLNTDTMQFGEVAKNFEGESDRP